MRTCYWLGQQPGKSIPVSRERTGGEFWLHRSDNLSALTSIARCEREKSNSKDNGNSNDVHKYIHNKCSEYS